MTRKFLSGLGIESEVIDKILDQAGSDLEREKEVAEKLRNEIKTLQDGATAKQKEFDDFKASQPDAEKLKAAHETEKTAHAETKTAMQKLIDDEKAAHESYRNEIAAEQDSVELDKLVSAALKDAGMNSTVIPKALKLYDREIVERKDGKICNSDKVVEHFKSEWADFFGAVKQQKAEVGTAPTAPPATYTLDQIRKMTTTEINNNWDAVQATLQKGASA